MPEPTRRLPNTSVDPSVLAQHMTSLNPHPGVCMQYNDPILSLRCLTLYRNITDFRVMPKLMGATYAPFLVLYVGENGRDSATVESYVQYHYYRYSGAKVGRFPKWEDVTSSIVGTVATTNQSSTIPSATVTNEEIIAHNNDTNAHASLFAAVAPKEHTHSASDISGIGDVISAYLLANPISQVVQTASGSEAGTVTLATTDEVLSGTFTDSNRVVTVGDLWTALNAINTRIDNISSGNNSSSSGGGYDDLGD